MSKAEKKTPASALKMRADELTENGITTRESYREALPLLFTMRRAAVSLKAFAKALETSADALSEGAAAYAKDHVTALDEPLHDVAKGKVSGSVEIDGNVYTLTLTDGPIKRVNGDNMTKDFLEGLPKDWTKTRPELDVTAINRLGVGEEALFRHGLIRQEKRMWTMKTAAEGIVANET